MRMDALCVCMRPCLALVSCSAAASICHAAQRGRDEQRAQRGERGGEGGKSERGEHGAHEREHRYAHRVASLLLSCPFVLCARCPPLRFAALATRRRAERIGAHTHTSIINNHCTHRN